MTTSDSRSGRCLCGAVTFTVPGAGSELGVCHCDMCRRWTGGAWPVLHTKNPVTFTGEDNIVRYRSSDWAERGFCGTCGTILFYHLLGNDEYALSAGALDNQSGLQFTSQIFIDEKPGWYDFANETSKLTGPEVIAMYAPKGG